MASSNTLGLTEFTRRPRGSSIAAARTKPSIAQLTRAAEAQQRIESWLNTPLVKVDEAQSSAN